MDRFELQRDVGWLIFDVSRLLMRSFEKKVREVGLTPHQWRVLLQIGRREGQTQTEIAEETEIARAPLGRLLDKLEEQGVIERRQDPHDRRAKRIYLVEREGKTFMEPFREQAKEQFDTVYGKLPDSKLLELIRMLDHIKTNIQSAEQNGIGAARTTAQNESA